MKDDKFGNMHMRRDPADQSGQTLVLNDELLAQSVGEAIRMAEGDVRAALVASLIANAYLEAEIERLVAAVARGYVRGRLYHGLERADRRTTD